MVLVQKQTHRSIEQNRKSRNRPTTIWSMFDKAERISNGKKTITSTNGVGNTGQLHAKELNWTTFSHQTPK